MFCPNCGAGGQTLRFCAKCGAALNAAPVPHQPTIDNKVNVTVNVGAPVIIADGKHASHVAQPRGSGQEWHRNPAVIILSLILFFPLGLALMWTSSPWRDDTKWAVSGLFLWPLWARFIWRQHWAQGVKIAALAVLVLGYGALLAGTAVGGAAFLFVALPTFIWALRSAQQPGSPAPGDAGSDDVRSCAETRLDACHDLITEIESGIAMELLPMDSPARRQYLRGLELREEGATLLRRAVSLPDVAVANERVTQALTELTGAHDALMAGTP